MDAVQELRFPKFFAPEHARSEEGLVAAHCGDYFRSQPFAISAGEGAGARQRALELGCEFLLQPPSRAWMARLDRRARNSERIGSISNAEVLDFAHHAHSAECTWYAGDRAYAHLPDSRAH